MWIPTRTPPLYCQQPGHLPRHEIYFCQSREYGQIAPVYSISAGLDYPGIGRSTPWLHDIGRAEYVPVTDDRRWMPLNTCPGPRVSFRPLSRRPAVAYCRKLASNHGKDQS